MDLANIHLLRNLLIEMPGPQEAIGFDKMLYFGHNGVVAAVYTPWVKNGHSYRMNSSSLDGIETRSAERPPVTFQRHSL
jgi:hypothetical protein